MKKLFALLLAMMLVFSLAACGNGETPSGDEGGGTSQSDNQSGEENNEGVAWPENEFTALIPKPKTGTIAEEDSFENAYFKGHKMTLTNWSVEDCKAYAEELKEAGFTQPGTGYDSVVVTDDGSNYSFGAKNADGVYVTIGTNVERKTGSISIQVTQ